MKIIALFILFLSSTVVFAANQSNASLKMGSVVYAISGERANTIARVVGIDGNIYTLKFDSDGAVGLGWTQGDVILVGNY